jgi:hypothetical protein
VRTAPTLFACALLGACQCLHPVDECEGRACADAGRPDAGVDAGRPDAGASDAGAFACRIWGGAGVGECAAVTGYVFDGTRCRGECVQYPIRDPGIFPSIAECVHACAEPYCRTELLAAALPQPFTPAAYCDDLVVDTSLPWLVQEAFPLLDAGCSLPTGMTTCSLLHGQVLGDAGYLEACAATLVPETSRVTCWLYGP